MRVLQVDVLEELVTVFCMLDYKGVIHIPEPYVGRVRAEPMALTSNSSMNKFGNKWAHGRNNGHTMNLFKILTLEEEVSIFQAKLQQGDYLRDGHG